MTDLDKLESLCREATPGPREISVDGRKLIVWATGGTYQRLAYLDELPANEGDLAFICAASPDVVLAMIKLVRDIPIWTRHGPAGRGGEGPCSPECLKCRAEAALHGAAK